jgi:hypothetical protein
MTEIGIAGTRMLPDKKTTPMCVSTKFNDMSKTPDDRCDFDMIYQKKLAGELHDSRIEQDACRNDAQSICFTALKRLIHVISDHSGVK